MNQNPEEIMA